MTTTHTPGPWTVYETTEKGNPCFPGIEAEGRDGHAFSVVVYGIPEDDRQGVQGLTQEEALANARLIAAAPELFEALKQLVEHGGIGPELMFDDARAAIAKAECLP